MWEGLVNGCSGITRLTDDWTEHVPVGIGGRVPGFDSSDYLSSKEQRRIPRVSQFAIVGALQAADDAGLPPASLDEEGERVAVVMGTTMGPHPLAESMTTKYRGNGHRRPNPISFVNCLPNMPAHYVSQFLHARGPLQTPIAACATGTQAIGDAAELIRAGRADVVFAGGTEAILVDYVIAGFASLSALAEGYEQDPAAASRPFDADRGGFVLSEGCGVLVLENLAHARARGAEIYAEVVGHASTSDAHHIAQIEPNARGMIGAVQGALDDARLPAEAIGAVNAHGANRNRTQRPPGNQSAAATSSAHTPNPPLSPPTRACSAT